MLACLAHVKHYHSKGNTDKMVVQDTGRKYTLGTWNVFFLEVKIIVSLIIEVISKQLIFTYVLSITTD